jgi:hypothetical protein
MQLEPIYAALFAKLDAMRVAGTLKNASRHLEHIADYDVMNMPAGFQHQTTLPITESKRGLSIRQCILNVDWYFYVPASQDSPASPILNALVSAALAALEPAGYDAKQTLGGLAADCYAEGTVEFYEGVLQDRAVAIIPIKVIAPGT